MNHHYQWCRQLRTDNPDDCTCYDDERRMAAEEREDMYERHHVELDDWGRP